MDEERQRRPSIAHAPPHIEEELEALDPYNASFAFRPSTDSSPSPIRSHARNARKGSIAFDPSPPSPPSPLSPLSTLAPPSPLLAPSSSSHKIVKQRSLYHLPPKKEKSSYSSPLTSPTSQFAPHPPFGSLFAPPSPHSSPLSSYGPPLSSVLSSSNSDQPLLFEEGASPSTPPHYIPSPISSPSTSSSPLEPVIPTYDQGMRRRPQLKLQISPQPMQMCDPISPSATKPPTSVDIPISGNLPPKPLRSPSIIDIPTIAVQPPANKNGSMSARPHLQQHHSKFNIRLTAEESLVLRSLSRTQSELSSNYQRGASVDEPPTLPSSAPISFSAPTTPLSESCGTFRRKNSGGFAPLPQSPQEASAAISGPVPIESGLIFSEGSGSFRRKTAGGTGSWDPAYAHGLQEFEVEAPDENPILAFLQRALFGLLKMHFLALLCSCVLLLYLGLYTPFIITLDLKLAMDSTHSTFYNAMDYGDRLSLGIGYGFHNAFTGIFPLFLMMRVIGFQQVKFLIPFNVLMAIMIASFVFVHYYESSAYKSLLTIYPIVVEVLVGIEVIGTAALFGYRKNKLRSITAFIASLTLALLLFVGILDFFGVPLYLSCTDFQKSIFRISVVPCLFIIKIVLVRLLCRINERSGIYLRTDSGTFIFLVALVPVFVRAFYGRIFFTNVSSVGNLAWNAIIVEIFDILFKLAHWNRRLLFRPWTKDIQKFKYMAPLLADPAGDSLYALCLTFEKSVDVIGIAFAAFLQFFNNKAFAENPDYGFTAECFIVLYLVQTVSHLVSLRLEIAHKIPVFQTLRNHKIKDVLFPMAIMTLAICAICGWRGIFIINDIGL